MKKRKARPFWERAYKGHAYWLGKVMLGKITLTGHRPEKYRWEAGGRIGTAEALGKAKAAVEMAVFNAERQLDLFTP